MMRRSVNVFCAAVSQSLSEHLSLHEDLWRRRDVDAALAAAGWAPPDALSLSQLAAAAPSGSVIAASVASLEWCPHSDTALLIAQQILTCYLLRQLHFAASTVDPNSSFFAPFLGENVAHDALAVLDALQLSLTRCCSQQAAFADDRIAVLQLCCMVGIMWAGSVLRTTGEVPATAYAAHNERLGRLQGCLASHKQCRPLLLHIHAFLRDVSSVHSSRCSSALESVRRNTVGEWLTCGDRSRNRVAGDIWGQLMLRASSQGSEKLFWLAADEYEKMPPGSVDKLDASLTSIATGGFSA